MKKDRQEHRNHSVGPWREKSDPTRSKPKIDQHMARPPVSLSPADYLFIYCSIIDLSSLFGTWLIPRDYSELSGYSIKIGAR